MAKVVLDEEELHRLKNQHESVQQDIDRLNPLKRRAVKSAQAQVQATIDEMNSDLFDNYDHEDRIRAAGYKPSDAEEIALLAKGKAVGQLFSWSGQIKVKTPFNTVVDAQAYVTALQDRLLQLTTVPVEVEVANLKKELSTFTQASVFGLIKIVFNKIFKRGIYGKQKKKACK